MGPHTYEEYLWISGNSFKVQAIKSEEKIRDKIRDRAMQIPKKLRDRPMPKILMSLIKKTKCMFTTSSFFYKGWLIRDDFWN